MTGSCATRCPWPTVSPPLKRRAKAAGIPVIYANDNFGRWKSDFRWILERCLQEGDARRPLAERLAPDEDDYFVLKPKHSAFFATTLHTLLRYLSVPPTAWRPSR